VASDSLGQQFVGGLGLAGQVSSLPEGESLLLVSGPEPCFNLSPSPSEGYIGLTGPDLYPEGGEHSRVSYDCPHDAQVTPLLLEGSAGIDSGVLERGASIVRGPETFYINGRSRNV
jgi:hypothetical protein